MYTQHVCVLKELLEEIYKGRSIDQQYPFISSEVPYRRPPTEIIVFIVGGATYEEALAVHQLNQMGHKVILGGTTIHNSETFLDEVVAATSGIPLTSGRKHLAQFHSANA